LDGDQPVARSLHTHKTTQTQNKRTQTPMPSVGFEPTTPAFEKAKTVHALDRAATAIGGPSPAARISNFEPALMSAYSFSVVYD
jgi:hypothetical protein